MLKKVSFVIPAKNEERSVKKLYEEILIQTKKMKLKYEFVFVDDGSTDKTFDVLEKIHKNDRK